MSDADLVVHGAYTAGTETRLLITANHAAAAALDKVYTKMSLDDLYDDRPSLFRHLYAAAGAQDPRVLNVLTQLDPVVGYRNALTLHAWGVCGTSGSM